MARGVTGDKAVLLDGLVANCGHMLDPDGVVERLFFRGREAAVPLIVFEQDVDSLFELVLFGAGAHAQVRQRVGKVLELTPIPGELEVDNGHQPVFLENEIAAVPIAVNEARLELVARVPVQLVR